MQNTRLNVSVNNLVILSSGAPPRLPWIRSVSILVCSVDGCMAEILTPIYRGKFINKIHIPCHNLGIGDGKIAGVAIRVDESYNSEYKLGTVHQELTERLRRLSDGTYVILN